MLIGNNNVCFVNIIVISVVITVYYCKCTLLLYNNNNNNIYLKSNIQCTYRYEFSGLYNNNIQLQ